MTVQVGVNFNLLFTVSPKIVFNKNYILMYSLHIQRCVIEC